MMTKRILSIAIAAVLISGVVSVVSLNATGRAAYAEDEKMTGQMMDRHMEGRAFGTIASIQNDDKGQPAWIASGIWKAWMRPPQSNTTTAPDVKFIARFGMVKLDGTAMHMHSMSDLVISKVSSSGNTTTLVGNVTMTMKDAPQKNIPVTIKIMNNKVISIMLDPAVNAHLGNTPLYGTISKMNGAYHEMVHMNESMAMSDKKPKEHEEYKPENEGAHVDIVKNAQTLADKAFSPNPLTVKVGTEVTWKNADTAAHTVTQGDSSNGPTEGGFDSKLMAPKKEFKFEFEKAGTFNYYCQLHPAMVGTVTVQ